VIKDPHKIIIRPVITEKTTQLKGTSGVICFEVARRANKIEIKSAIELLFKTKVAEVRTQMKIGKVRRVGRNMGKTKDWKKAYVRLREGEKPIEYFEAV
jgi:large subunit ribosomal protein L23